MSIPTSLIVVVLVLAWLVVLVPMVARRREAVPEAEMVGGTFRVLQRSDGTRRRPAFRRRPAVEVGDWEDPRGQELSGDDELDEELLDEEYDDADGDGYGDRDDGYAEYGEDDDELDSDESEMSRTAEVPVATPAGQFFGRRSAGSHPYRPAGQPSSGSHPYRAGGAAAVGARRGRTAIRWLPARTGAVRPSLGFCCGRRRRRRVRQ